MTPRRYLPAWWLPGGHLPTLWGKFARRASIVSTEAAQWETDDGDRIEVQHLQIDRVAPTLVVLHGLEGTMRSHYLQGLLAEAVARRWNMLIMLFRSCGSQPNLARRFYHSGETTDLDYVVRRLNAEGLESPLLLAGVSLGGNVLLKWLGEHGDNIPERIRGAVAVSVPYDLARGSAKLRQGLSRIYARHFLKTLRAKTEEKLRRYPDLLPPETLDRASTLFAFDDLVTAPLHGFRDAADYYRQSSSLQFLSRIRRPTLLLSAEDDPFLPAAVLDLVRDEAQSNPSLSIEFVKRGGHVGFVSGRAPWQPFYYAEWRVFDFLASTLPAAIVP